MQVVIRNPGMESLCRAEVDRGDNGGLTVSPLPGMAAALFDYYFFRGGRAVILDMGELQLTASLRTRWRDNRRIWWIEAMTPRSLDLLPCEATGAAAAEAEPAIAVSA